jgi:flagellar hook-length control protein FliK
MQTQSIQNTLLNTSAPTGQKRAEGDLDFKQALARQVERQPLPQPIKVPMKSAPMTKPAPTAQAQPSKPVTPNPAAKTSQVSAANQAKPAQQTSQAKAAEAPEQAQQADAADSTRDTAAADATAAAATAAASEAAPAETAAQPADAAAAEAAAAAAAAVDPMANMLAMIAAYNQQTQPAQPADGTAEAPAEGGTGGDPLAALQDETAGQGGKPDAGLGADTGAAGKGKADAAALPGGDARALDAGKLELSAGAAKTEMKAEAFAAKLADAAAATQPVLPQATQTLVATAQAADVAASNQLQARVGSDAWEQQLGQKVVWMVAGGDQSASLTLNPPDLGPLQIVLNVSNDQASVSFMAAEPETRQALEDAMPKLRETMSEAGIQLGDASVSTGSQDQRQAFAEQAEARAAAGSRRFGNDGGDGAAQPQPEPVIRRTVLGAVDTFA